MALPSNSSWFHNPNNNCFASNLQITIHLGEQYFPCCCFLPVTFKNISQNFAFKCLQSVYQIWDVRGVEKISSVLRESKFCHPSHIQSHYWLLFRLKITYTSLTILKVAVCTACGIIKLLCIMQHSRFISNLKQRYPATGRSGPRGSGLVKALDLLDFRHYKCGRSSAKGTSRLYPRRNPWYSFSEAESTSGHMVLSEKIPSDTTGDRSWDRPTSSAAP